MYYFDGPIRTQDIIYVLQRVYKRKEKLLALSFM